LIIGDNLNAAIKATKETGIEAVLYHYDGKPEPMVLYIPIES